MSEKDGPKDLFDNEIDGLTDCEDKLREHTELTCDDTIDYNGNGDIDCPDPYCYRPSCSEICNDGIDNDSDGKTDCADSECVGQLGPNGETCELTEVSCVDDQDSDGDGLCDCASDESHQPVTQYKVNERGRHFKAGHLADIVNKSPYLQKLQRRGKELMEVLEQTGPSADDDK
jgi:hypothetical protein